MVSDVLVGSSAKPVFPQRSLCTPFRWPGLLHVIFEVAERGCAGRLLRHRSETRSSSETRSRVRGMWLGDLGQAGYGTVLRFVLKPGGDQNVNSESIVI